MKHVVLVMMLIGALVITLSGCGSQGVQSASSGQPDVQATVLAQVKATVAAMASPMRAIVPTATPKAAPTATPDPWDVSGPTPIRTLGVDRDQQIQDMLGALSLYGSVDSVHLSADRVLTVQAEIGPGGPPGPVIPINSSLTWRVSGAAISDYGQICRAVFAADSPVSVQEVVYRAPFDVSNSYGQTTATGILQLGMKAATSKRVNFDRVTLDGLLQLSEMDNFLPMVNVKQR